MLAVLSSPLLCLLVVAAVLVLPPIGAQAVLVVLVPLVAQAVRLAVVTRLLPSAPLVMLEHLLLLLPPPPTSHCCPGQPPALLVVLVRAGAQAVWLAVGMPLAPLATLGRLLLLPPPPTSRSCPGRMPASAPRTGRLRRSY